MKCSMERVFITFSHHFSVFLRFLLIFPFSNRFPLQHSWPWSWRCQKEAGTWPIHRNPSPNKPSPIRLLLGHSIPSVLHWHSPTNHRRNAPESADDTWETREAWRSRLRSNPPNRQGSGTRKRSRARKCSAGRRRAPTGAVRLLSVLLADGSPHDVPVAVQLFPNAPNRRCAF